ncbi:hypothetical protein BGX30_000118, partial [Mortierella sp. GBA39]
QDKTVRLWSGEVDSWSCVAVVSGCPEAITSATWNPVVPMEFVTGSDDGSVRVWHISGAEAGDVSIRMRWSSYIGQLYVVGLTFKGAVGLSSLSERLLIQRDAISEDLEGDDLEPREEIDDLPPLVKDEPPKVLIVGAGLAGFYLGLLLEATGIPYEIFERVAETKPLGGVMALSGNILCSFERMGIFDKLARDSKPTYDAMYYSAELKTTAHICVQDEVTGYKDIYLRADLYNLLFNKIPTHKIHMSKKSSRVMLRFSNNTTVHGDILVRADGAHSGVRNHRYKTLHEQGLLPKGDTKTMNKGYMYLLGTTLPLDPNGERYKDLVAEDSECSFHIGDNSMLFTWMTYTTTGNRICWNVVIQSELAEIEEDQFRQSDWAPERNGRILD